MMENQIVIKDILIVIREDNEYELYGISCDD